MKFIELTSAYNRNNILLNMNFVCEINRREKEGCRIYIANGNNASQTSIDVMESYEKIKDLILNNYGDD
jgi:hypothetical protein